MAKRKSAEKPADRNIGAIAGPKASEIMQVKATDAVFLLGLRVGTSGASELVRVPIDSLPSIKGAISGVAVRGPKAPVEQTTAKRSKG